jgi:type IV pilus assembly protein PilO
MRFGLRELVFLIVLVAVPVVSWLYVFKPRNDDIKEARNEIAVKQARLDRLEEMQAEIEDLGLAVEQGRESIMMIEAKLPAERDVEGILEQVWQIATGHGLIVKSVKSEKPKPATNYRELPLKMIVEGRFDGFYQFLLELENLPRITRIFDMTIERVSRRASGPEVDVPAGSMRAEFILSIYFEPDTNAGA